MKLLVVSNRLPITIKKGENGFEYTRTSGGLVTGLKSINDTIRFEWFGNISGTELDEEEKETIRRNCWEKFHSIPVFIDPVLNHDCYDGFCNAILWPILHSFKDDVAFTIKNYNAYVEYNRIFCDKICETIEDGDIVWVHDYHLMILPEMLKKKSNKNFKIMFFLHTPFPPAEMMETLACRREIVSGMAHSDLVAFHSFDYAINFHDTCAANNIEVRTQLDAIPIGIDPEMFRDTLKEKKTIERIEEFKKMFQGKKIILGVDRTDYIKGMPHRLKGFQRFLEKYPEFIGKVVFLQVGVPSRTSVKEYSSYTTKLNELSSETNSKVGSIEEMHVYFLNKSVDFNELCALYAVSDMLLVTSLKDGMNLVALEYVSCQDEKNGVLLLSESAGASTTLCGGLEINSWNIEEIADGIQKAIEMPVEERIERHKINRKAVDSFTSVKWAERNLDGLSKDWRKSLMS
ncbi:alpha,alpha-trehalose-phosphate synthase [Encephalitozoon intestinalis ATCC 50506]|uniref:Alpha,alpha-trehalose-phosphate synthase n=1 Tax=Encephalitozoon intestinalis (strain ATCC 50506) TaxID=876142 RepID=E0S5E7_ENCIT|nr:alpha,alpha-trehalose-phosphate synthase [Encephalitozoon intestinalis ATCC 50506]ADM10932.1 alpha,alpha-trehalose-phosphate synthase [Encephalitozoon intestinalis ATCC 50506]UTX44566.1 alpha,alpha-trehalose-phosphate synthase [Encephalitozoon intestinalis]